jgi:hypothetical protein
VLRKRTWAKRRRKAADSRRPEHPLDDAFGKDAKRIRRRRGWGAVVDAALTVLDMLP